MLLAFGVVVAVVAVATAVSVVAAVLAADVECLAVDLSEWNLDSAGRRAEGKWQLSLA